MTANMGVITGLNSFYGYPSILALRDIQREIKKQLKTPLRTKTIAKLLALDPLALARGLRIANAPIHPEAGSVDTIRACLKSLGGAACATLLRIPALDTTGTTRLRKLWLHSLATAHTAAALAEASGELPPDLAYCMGLLHDFSSWLTLLKTIHESEAAPSQGADLLALWNIPKTLVEPIAWLEKNPQKEASTAATKLLVGAEHFAELAGFHHPDQAPEEQELLQSLYDDQLIPAQQVTRFISSALENVGLTLAKISDTPTDLKPKPTDQIPIDGKPTVYDLGKACSTVLEFTRGESLVVSVNALATAVRKFLDFDRVYFFKWSGPGRKIRFRVGNDMSPGPLPRHEMTPARWEMSFLGRLVGEGTAGLLKRPLEAQSPILDLLGTDQLIVAPVMAHGTNHGFILADRAIRCLPLNENRLQDIKAITGLTALITENLLIQRVAWRHGHAANMDPLTGVFNRRAGLMHLAKILDESLQTDRVSTVIMMDLDNFKRVNDTWGHQVGDQVLKSVARILLDHFDDIGSVNRIGGEEFLVILPGKKPEKILPLVEIVRQAIESSTFNQKENEPINVTVSMGVTASLLENDSVDQLIQRVDAALYASKSRGRNRFSVDLGLPED